MTTTALDNARAALAKLIAFLSEPATSDRDRAGVIQAFEFTFETTWKLLERVAEREGLEAESPKRAVTAAYKLGIVHDENLWLAMLQDRNLTTHVYHSQLADRIFTAISTKYAAALADAVRLAGDAIEAEPRHDTTP